MLVASMKRFHEHIAVSNGTTVLSIYDVFTDTRERFPASTCFYLLI
jgi:hypothetical protein